MTGVQTCALPIYITVNIRANAGDIWLPVQEGGENAVPEKPVLPVSAKEPVPSVPAQEETPDAGQEAISSPAPAQNLPDAPQALEAAPQDDSFEKGKIAGLQEAILAIMEKKGPVTDRMRQDVYDNTHHDSLINWVKSFH